MGMLWVKIIIIIANNVVGRASENWTPVTEGPWKRAACPCEV